MDNIKKAVFPSMCQAVIIVSTAYLSRPLGLGRDVQALICQLLPHNIQEKGRRGVRGASEKRGSQRRHRVKERMVPYQSIWHIYAKKKKGSTPFTVLEISSFSLVISQWRPNIFLDDERTHGANGLYYTCQPFLVMLLGSRCLDVAAWA